MGQYLGGVVNVVVGAYTGNWWEISAGVMQIVGTKENNKDLQTAGAVVGMVGLVGSTQNMAGTNESWGLGNTASTTASASANAATPEELTATNVGAPTTATGQQIGNVTSPALEISAPVATTAATAKTAGDTLSTYDKITNALSTPAGIGVLGGAGNAFGNIYAAQKTAEANLQIQQNNLALERQRMAIANTVGTGVVAPSTTGLLSPTGLPSPATTPAATPTGLTV